MGGWCSRMPNRRNVISPTGPQNRAPGADLASVSISKKPNNPASNASTTAAYTGGASSEGMSAAAALGGLSSAKASHSPTPLQRVMSPTAEAGVQTGRQNRAPSAGRNAAGRGGGMGQAQRRGSSGGYPETRRGTGSFSGGNPRMQNYADHPHFNQGYGGTDFRGHGGTRGRPMQDGYRPLQPHHFTSGNEFDCDYDLEKANEQFQEPLSHLDEIEDEDKPEVKNGTESNAEEESSEIAEPEGQDELQCYDKAKSFFDKISCEALERPEGDPTRSNWRKERELNQKPDNPASNVSATAEYAGGASSDDMNLNVKSWTCREVAAWLREIGYEMYTKYFMKNEIDGEALLAMSTEQLLVMVKLQIFKFGPMIKFIKVLDELKTSRSPTPLQRVMSPTAEAGVQTGRQNRAPGAGRNAAGCGGGMGQGRRRGSSGGYPEARRGTDSFSGGNPRMQSFSDPPHYNQGYRGTDFRGRGGMREGPMHGGCRPLQPHHFMGGNGGGMHDRTGLQDWRSKFDGDYDFEKANQQFQEPLSHLKDEIEDEEKPEVKESTESNAEEESGETEEPESQDEAQCYVKAKSFFDETSCESLEKNVFSEDRYLIGKSGHKVVAIRLLNGPFKERQTKGVRRRRRRKGSTSPSISSPSTTSSNCEPIRPLDTPLLHLSLLDDGRPVQALVLWAQRKDVIFLTIAIDECKEPETYLNVNRLSFKCHGGPDQREHECTIEFFRRIDPFNVRRIFSSRNIQFVIGKKEAGTIWPRLLFSRKPVHWCKVDTSKWKKGDDLSDDDGFNFNFHYMMGQMGGFNDGKPGIDDLEDGKNKDQQDLEDGEDESKAKLAEEEAKAGDAPAEKSGGDSGDKATEMPTSS